MLRVDRYFVEIYPWVPFVLDNWAWRRRESRDEQRITLRQKAAAVTCFSSLTNLVENVLGYNLRWRFATAKYQTMFIQTGNSALVRLFGSESKPLENPMLP